MARGKNQVVEDLPVDKVDQFIKKHYKNILFVFGVAIVAVVAAYTIFNVTASGRQKKLETIATVEKDGFSSIAQVEEYAKLAGTFDFAADYIKFRAGAALVAMDDNEAAQAELVAVGGDFAEYAKSLSYDIAGGTVDTQYLMGNLSPVWYYRAVLEAEGVERQALMLQFRLNWAESQLLAQLDKWGIQ